MQKLSEYILDDIEKNKDHLDFSELKGKTILVTGATGIVGTYLVARLKHENEKKKLNIKLVAVIHGEPEKYYRDLVPSKTKFIKGDLSDEKFLASLPNADYIIHAAGYGQPGKFLEDPIKTLKINTLGTFFLLEKLNHDGKFLFLSTSEVYSGSEKIPYKEDDIGRTNTDHKRSCYIEGKRSGEAIVLAHRQKGVLAKAARLSLAYGPGTKKGDKRVLNSFIEKAFILGKIEMLDGGEAKRTYCYITDATEIMWNILFFGKDFIYNVGGESKTTIKELAEKVGSCTDVPVKIPETTKNIAGAPEDVSLDLEKIKKEFGKTKFVDLDNGLEKTIEWQKILYGEK